MEISVVSESSQPKDLSKKDKEASASKLAGKMCETNFSPIKFQLKAVEFRVSTYTYGKFLKTNVWSNFGLRFFRWTLVSYFGFLSGRR